MGKTFSFHRIKRPKQEGVIRSLPACRLVPIPDSGVMSITKATYSIVEAWQVIHVHHNPSFLANLTTLAASYHDDAPAPCQLWSHLSGRCHPGTIQRGQADRGFSLAPPAIAKHPRSGAEWEGRYRSQGELPHTAPAPLWGNDIVSIEPLLALTRPFPREQTPEPVPLSWRGLL